jgi:hypothetical protein
LLGGIATIMSSLLHGMTATKNITHELYAVLTETPKQGAIKPSQPVGSMPMHINRLSAVGTRIFDDRHGKIDRADAGRLRDLEYTLIVSRRHETCPIDLTSGIHLGNHIVADGSDHFQLGTLWRHPFPLPFISSCDSAARRRHQRRLCVGGDTGGIIDLDDGDAGVAGDTILIDNGMNERLSGKFNGMNERLSGKFTAARFGHEA